MPLAVLLLGDDWRLAGSVMAGLSGMGIALALEAIAIEIFKVSGRPDVLPRLHALWAALSIGLVVGLVRFGAVWVGLAWSISTTVVALVALSTVPVALGVSHRQLAGAVLPALASALLVADGLRIAQALLAWDPHANVATIGWLLVQVVAGGALYVGVMGLVDRGSVRDFSRALRVVVRRTSAATP